MLFFISKIVRCLPPTRLYRLKAKLYQLCGVKIHDTARIVSSVTIVGNGCLEIGRDTFIGHETFISVSSAGVSIGDCVDIAPRVVIVNGTHEIDTINEHTAGKGVSKKIVIGNGVWIGAGAILLPGITIGEKAVIGAGSVVRKNVFQKTVNYGNPCREKYSIEKTNTLFTQDS